MTRYSCSCKVCEGRAILAPEGYITGTPKKVRILVHNYVAHAYGTSPVSQVLTARAGIVKAD